MSADLSLVTRCLQGDEAAWEEFLLCYRSKVFNWALAMVRDGAAADEIASAVWGELYGVRGVDTDDRRSKLAHYSGRGSLEGWLRTLVAQAVVDRYRRERRFVPLEAAELGYRTGEHELAAVDVRLEKALDKALAELRPEQRLVLAAYYLDERTFAEIGRMIGSHESSVSRQCRRSIELVRKRTIHHLRAAGLSMTEAQEVMGSDVRGISLDVRRRLQVVKNTP